MKWEPNITGHPIDVWQKQAANRTTNSVPSITGGVDRANSVGQANSATVRPSIIDLSDNIMLAHYQRERR